MMPGLMTVYVILQAVIIQPLGHDGIMILASDTLRGFGPSDQVCLHDQMRP